MFMEIDVDTILATPVKEDFEDVRLRDGPQATSSNDGATSLHWQKIWKIECTPKIQQFVWRLAHNSGKAEY
jgi:hypothetical protein